MAATTRWPELPEEWRAAIEGAENGGFRLHVQGSPASIANPGSTLLSSPEEIMAWMAVQIVLSGGGARGARGDRALAEERAAAGDPGAGGEGAAEGKPNRQIAPEVGLSEQKVGQRRRRFAERRLEGLADLPRPGVPPTYDHDRRVEVFKTACSAPPEGETHWTVRSLAERVGIGKSQTHAILPRPTSNPTRCLPRSTPSSTPSSLRGRERSRGLLIPALLLRTAWHHGGRLLVRVKGGKGGAFREGSVFRVRGRMTPGSAASYVWAIS